MPHKNIFYAHQVLPTETLKIAECLREKHLDTQEGSDH